MNPQVSFDVSKLETSNSISVNKGGCKTQLNTRTTFITSHLVEELLCMLNRLSRFVLSPF